MGQNVNILYLKTPLTKIHEIINLNKKMIAQIVNMFFFFANISQ